VDLRRPDLDKAQPGVERVRAWIGRVTIDLADDGLVAGGLRPLEQLSIKRSDRK